MPVVISHLSLFKTGYIVLLHQIWEGPGSEDLRRCTGIRLGCGSLIRLNAEAIVNMTEGYLRFDHCSPGYGQSQGCKEIC